MSIGISLGPSRQLRGPGMGLPELITLAFGLLVLWKSLPSVPVEYVRIASGVLILFIAWCAVLAGRPVLGCSRKIMRIGSAWLVLCAVYLVPPLLSDGEMDLVWVFTDVSVTLFPLGLLYVGERIPGIFSGARALVLLGSLLFVAGVTAFVASGFGQERFMPPSVALIAWIWLALLREERRRLRLVLLGLNVFVLLLSLLSGGREVTLIWGIGGVLSLYMAGYGRKALFICLTAGALALALASLGAVNVTGAGLGGTFDFPTIERYRAPSGRAAREGLVPDRVNEAKDVVEGVDQGGAASLVFGHGHGATYRPERYVVKATQNEDGLSHQIHTGPLLALYRYGVLGLSVYVFVLVWLVGLFRRSRGRWGGVDHRLVDYFLLAAALYMCSFFVRNVLADPGFAFVFGGLLWQLYGSGRPSQLASARPSSDVGS